MDERRIALGQIFRDILGTGNVYFQPPASVRMSYPCIVYRLDDIRKVSADDGSYGRHKRYLVTLVDKNPDSDYQEELLKLPLCRFGRFYTQDGLNHWVYEIYY